MKDFKEKIILQLKERMASDKKNLEESLNLARQEALDAPGRMESRHDSTKQESSYKAETILARLGDLERNLKLLEPSQFLDNGDVIGLGSLIHLAVDKERKTFFILPGGESDEFTSSSGEKIFIISPDTPLAQKIVGRRVGEEIIFREKKIKIESIQ